MRWMIALIYLVLLGEGTSRGQERLSEAALDHVIRLGTLAALAPLCGVREEGWAFDLRRAAIFESTRTERPDDPTLKMAPESERVVGALSFAEAEALESFAEAAPAVTCEKLPQDPDLAEADGMVQRFRRLKADGKPQS